MGCIYERKRLVVTGYVGDRDFLALLYVFLYLSAPGRTRPHFAERVCQEGISPTVSGSCGKDPPIAHTHLAAIPNTVAERG